MTEPTFRPKVYLKRGCPYSFKFLLFASEAGLLEHMEVIRADPDTSDFERIKERLSEALGKSATFPTVEIEPGRWQSDSDQLIELFARRYGIAPATLPALAFYRDSIFPQLDELHGG